MHPTSTPRAITPRLTVAVMAAMGLVLGGCSGAGGPTPPTAAPEADAPSESFPATGTNSPQPDNTARPSEFCQDVQLQFAALRFLPLSLGKETEGKTLDRTLTEVGQLKAASPTGVEQEVANLEEVISEVRDDPSQFDSQTLVDAMNGVEDWASTNC